MAGKVAAAVTPEQLQSARKLFESVNAEVEKIRADILRRQTGSDPAMLALVEQMLKADALGQSILDQPLEAAAGSAELKAGDRVGNYRIVREIGMGGMGAVFQAEPADAPGDFVAIKVVRWHSREISRRFEQEQAILSGLHHPNIARLLDSGTTGSHSPYFVMEYVEGAPIHEYCAGKPVDSRIRLFRQVCAAVSYLHQHLVVHRDLKPGNILVTPDGRAVVLDFGIAKLVDPVAPGATTQTLTQLRAYTPQYASPEQIRGGVTSTLSDVFSLGVLLFELLTGEMPFGAPANQMHDMLRRICEEPPRTPGISAELDNIVLKAIRKEPERRYASVDQFDEDLRRYLNQEPVLAHGDSIGYRTRKFVVRHKGSVAAGITIAVLLTGGVVATSIEAGIAREERARAESKARDAESQKQVAEQLRTEADRQRGIAEQRARDADRERANAERRLGELEKLAKGVVRIYDSKGNTSQAASAITENVRDSLLTLRQERVLEPGMAVVLDQIESARQGTGVASVANDPSWQVPEGWSASETRAREYRVGQDTRVFHAGKASIVLRSLISRPSGSGIAYRNFDAGKYRGKRVRLTIFLKSEAVARQAVLGLLTSFEAARATLAGTTPWKKYELVADIPANSQTVRVQLMLKGAGALWADNFSLEQVSSAIPVSIRLPRNLDFTEP